jgi:hypothetical protein
MSALCYTLYALKEEKEALIALYEAVSLIKMITSCNVVSMSANQHVVRGTSSPNEGSTSGADETTGHFRRGRKGPWSFLLPHKLLRKTSPVERSHKGPYDFRMTISLSTTTACKDNGIVHRQYDVQHKTSRNT